MPLPQKVIELREKIGTGQTVTQNDIDEAVHRKRDDIRIAVEYYVNQYKNMSDEKKVDLRRRHEEKMKEEWFTRQDMVFGDFHSTYD